MWTAQNIFLPEELQSGVAADLKLLPEGSLNGGVDLAELDGGLLVGKLLGGLGVLGGKSLQRETWRTNTIPIYIFT